jgi:hypothetical protein
LIDYIILAVVVAALVFVIVRLVHRRRAGTSPCAGCSGCGHANACSSAAKNVHKY